MWLKLREAKKQLLWNQSFNSNIPWLFENRSRSAREKKLSEQKVIWLNTLSILSFYSSQISYFGKKVEHRTVGVSESTKRCGFEKFQNFFSRFQRKVYF